MGLVDEWCVDDAVSVRLEHSWTSRLEDQVPEQRI